MQLTITQAPFRLPPLVRTLGILLGVALLLALPLIISSPYVLFIVELILTYVILAAGLNLPVGLTGQISLCQAAFWGLGAYFSAILTVKLGVSVWVALPLAGVFAGLFGALIGLTTRRVAGDYLALVTLGFGEVMRIVALNWMNLTRGPMGITGIPAPNPIHFFGNLTLSFDTYEPYYYLLLAAAALILWISHRITRSRVGLAMRSVAGNEIAAESLGVNITYYKILAFTLSAVYAGLGGQPVRPPGALRQPRELLLSGLGHHAEYGDRRRHGLAGRRGDRQHGADRGLGAAARPAGLAHDPVRPDPDHRHGLYAPRRRRAGAAEAEAETYPPAPLPMREGGGGPPRTGCPCRGAGRAQPVPNAGKGEIGSPPGRAAPEREGRERANLPPHPPPEREGGSGSPPRPTAAASGGTQATSRPRGKGEIWPPSPLRGGVGGGVRWPWRRMA